MVYDFDRITDRRGTGSLKWDVSERSFPCGWQTWIFRQLTIRDAVLKRAEHGIFGYCVIPDARYEAYIKWWESRHHFQNGKKNGCFYDRSDPRRFQCGTETDHSRGKCAGTDACLPYFLSFDCQ